MIRLGVEVRPVLARDVHHEGRKLPLPVFLAPFILLLLLLLASCGGADLGAVTGLVVTPGDSQNTLTWDGLIGSDSYNVYWEETTSAGVINCSGIPIAGITGTTYTHTGLTNGVVYNYGIVAVGVDAIEGACGGGFVSGAPFSDIIPPVTIAPLTEVSVTETIWSGSATIDEAGTGHCIALPTGSPAPTAAEVKAWSGASVAMTANTPADCMVTGLTPATTYDFYFAAEDTSGNLQLDADVSGPVTSTTLLGGPLGPVTGLVVVPGNGQNTLTWDPLVGAATYRVYWQETVFNDVVRCKGQKIKDIVGTTFVHTGLTNGVTYNYAIRAEDAAGNKGACGGGYVSGAPFLDITPPVTITPFTEVSVTETIWTGSATIDEAGRGYCVAVAPGSPAPTAAQVQAGPGGSVAMTANTPVDCQITGLTPGATYDFYFVAEDTSGNLQVDANVSGPVTSTMAESLIVNVVFPDTNLAACVNNFAAAKAWVTVSQMTAPRL